MPRIWAVSQTRDAPQEKFAYVDRQSAGKVPPGLLDGEAVKAMFNLLAGLCGAFWVRWLQFWSALRKSIRALGNGKAESQACEAYAGQV